MPKIFEVLVEVSVDKPKWPKLLAIIVSIFVGILLISAIVQQIQQEAERQSQIATVSAIARERATSTAEYQATQTSIKATKVAQDAASTAAENATATTRSADLTQIAPTQAAYATQQAKEAAAYLATKAAIPTPTIDPTKGLGGTGLKISGVALLTNKDVAWKTCGNFGSCDKVGYLEFKITNVGREPIFIYWGSYNGDCFYPSDIDGSGNYYRDGLRSEQLLNPGSSQSRFCGLFFLTDQDPAKASLVVSRNNPLSRNGYWCIYPYTNEVKDPVNDFCP